MEQNEKVAVRPGKPAVALEENCDVAIGKKIGHYRQPFTKSNKSAAALVLAVRSSVCGIGYSFVPQNSYYDH